MCNMEHVGFVRHPVCGVPCTGCAPHSQLVQFSGHGIVADVSNREAANRVNSHFPSFYHEGEIFVSLCLRGGYENYDVRKGDDVRTLALVSNVVAETHWESSPNIFIELCISPQRNLRCKE